MRSTVQPLRLVWASAAVFALATLGACTKPLLSPRDDRTQYSKNDRLRNQFVSQFTEDEFGYRRPNLRARLLPPE